MEEKTKKEIPEEEVLSEKNPGRMGTWTYSYGFSTTQALIELGKRMVQCQCRWQRVFCIWEKRIF